MFISKVSMMLLTIATITFFSMTGSAQAQLFGKKTVVLPTTQQGKVGACADLTDKDVGAICTDSHGDYVYLEEVTETKTKHTKNFVQGHHDKASKEWKYSKPFNVEYKDFDAVTKTSKDMGDNVIVYKNDDGSCMVCPKGKPATDAGCQKIVVTKVDVKPDNKKTTTTTTTTVYVPVDTTPAVKEVVIDARPTTTRIRYRDPRIAAQDEFNNLSDFCTQEIPDLIDNCGKDLDDTKSQRDAAAAALKTAKTAMDSAFKKMGVNCRKDCLQIAINPPDDLKSCKIDPTELRDYINKDDFVKADNNGRANSASAEAVNNAFPPQYPGLDDIKKQAIDDQLDNVCSKMLGKFRPGCQEAITAAGAIGRCEDYTPYADAATEYDKQKKSLAALDARLTKLADKTTGSACTLKRAGDIDRIRTSGCDCRQAADRSCARALQDANNQLQIVLRTPYCATCGYDNGQGGQGGCAYGYGCNNVSKFAQIAGALAGPVASLGLGAMNMITGIHSLNACTSSYASYLDVNRTVGMQPQPPMCGGYGGGFAGLGGIGLGGIGTGGIYNPYGMGATGVYNPYATMGMNGMYNPYLMNGGMGMGGFNGGISAGINLGVGNPYMASGMGYNPMMGMGGMGYGGMGYGGITGYNPQAALGNQYGVQQQMYDNQMRMQEMAAQNAVVQQSAYSGGMMGMMGSPYMNMGYQGGVNPYLTGNMGMLNTFQANPYAYSNPYAYTPGYSGISGGISGGITAGFNTGFQGGGGNMYNYNAYPAMTASPYAAYNAYTPNTYGYNAGQAGYGPYGNTGYYPQQSTGCGAQVGYSCGM